MLSPVSISSKSNILTGTSVRIIASGIPIFLAIYISISRIQQNVHNPSDVLGGALLGIAVAVLFWQLWIVIPMAENEKNIRRKDKWERIEGKIAATEVRIINRQESEGLLRQTVSVCV